MGTEDVHRLDMENAPAPPRTSVDAAVAETPPSSFDFKVHRARAIEEYGKIRPRYERLAVTIKHIIEEAASERGLKLNSIEARAKTVDSFGGKTETQSESDSTRPKYEHPLEDIEDMAGVRVITFLPRTVDEVGVLVSNEFEVLKQEDVGSLLRESHRFGYQSIHYIVRLREDRLRHTEYRKFDGLKAEIQVRTVLQHAWAEIEHDIRYKSSVTAPETIGRRFDALAGMLEIADREFQGIQDADEELRQGARKSIESGKLRGVEITPDSLHSYLDQRMGSDLRISDWSYEYQVRRLKDLGFKHLDQVESVMQGYDDDEVSRTVWGSRQGQLTRFEDVVMAGMGENFVSRIAKGDEFSRGYLQQRLEKIRQSKIKIGSYVPSG